jgi:hypothetical protein
VSVSARPGLFARTVSEGKARTRIGGSGTAPRRGAFGSWPRASGRDRCRSEPLSACARTRPWAGTGEAAAKAGWRADCRARDREAGNPRDPALRGRARAPRQPGLAARRARTAGSDRPPASREAESSSPCRCRPTSRRLMSAPLCRAGRTRHRTVFRRCQGLFSKLRRFLLRRNEEPSASSAKGMGRRCGFVAYVNATSPRSGH